VLQSVMYDIPSREDVASVVITREVVLNTEYNGQNTTPWGTEVVGFTAETKISRKEWGLTYNAALETGGFLVTMTGPIGDSLDLSEFRVAYHVQTIGSPQGEGGSDTYLGTGPDNIPVPEPTAATMAGLAGALMLLRRRRV